MLPYSPEELRRGLIAAAICAGIAENREDVFLDAMSAGVYEQWKANHKAVEHQFASM